MHYTKFKDQSKATQTPHLANKHPIRILHVVGGMNRGGIETWLMHILRHIDRDLFQMDFLVHTKEVCAYDEEIRAIGSKIIPCLEPSQPWLYALNFLRILREYGAYDIVHSHVHHFSGFVLRLAQQAGVPNRIAHSHLDSSLLEAKARWHRQLYLALTQQWITHYATVGVAASHQAGVNLFGTTWNTKELYQILYCAIDLQAFHEQVDRLAVRTELGIPANAFVIGHVGRFNPQKNHQFLIEIALEMSKQEPNMRFLLVGDGLLRANLMQKVSDLNLSDYVIFAGTRPDIPQLMLGAMDAFILPSLYEGLPLVLMEAQAAGLPCIFADVIPQEVEVIKPLLHPMSLSQPPVQWAEKILAVKQVKSKITQSEALSLVEQSPFNIHTSVQQLERMYLSGCKSIPFWNE